MNVSRDGKNRISQYRAESKTRAYKHCMKKIKTPFLGFNSDFENIPLENREINKAPEIISFLQSVKKVNEGKLSCVRRSLSACNINEHRNKYIPSPTITNATKTLWPMDSKLMLEADKLIAEVLGSASSKEHTDHIESVGMQIVELGVIYGPERFYVKAGGALPECSDNFKNFNANVGAVKRLAGVYLSPQIPSPSVFAFCNEFDRVLKRVCFIKDENSDGFYLYDFDSGNVCRMKYTDKLNLKVLPKELRNFLPLHTPVRLVNKITEQDFTRYINNLKKTGFIYIVGFSGPEVQAATTSEVQFPSPNRRFCDYLYCEGDCFLVYEENQNRRQNLQCN